MMHPSDFRKFATFSMRSNQPTNTMVANDVQIKLTIRDVWTIFQCKF